MTRRIVSFLFRALVPVLVVMALATKVDAAPPMRVVATLSTFADLVKQIGAEDVDVSHVVSPRFNPHFIEPKPSDVLKVKKAELFVHAGLDLEAWRGPLVDAAGNRRVRPGGERELDLSKGIRLLEVPDRPLSRAEGDIHIYGNPHYWLSPENAKIMAQTIAAKLSELDPVHAQAYQQRLDVFLQKLDQKISEWKREATAIHGKEVVAYHGEWSYLAEFLGVTIDQFLEPKPGIPPSPRQLGFLEGYMKAHGIKVIIQSTFYPKDSSETLAKRTGARLVILANNVGELPQARDYLSMIDYDIQQLAEALGGTHG